MRIFHNANIYAPQYPLATALAISHGHFIAMGTDEEILDGFSHKAKVINLRGRSIWPGLTDAHVHLRHLAESNAMANCETESLEKCLETIKTVASNLPQDAWVRGHGWNQNNWGSVFGNANLLDSVCGGRPVYLTAKSLHAAWVNSTALTKAGIDSQTADPPGGIIQRDKTGQPTGILFEASAMSLVESLIPKSKQTELIAHIRDLIPQLLKLGLVGVHDFDGVDSFKALQSCQHHNTQIRVHKIIPFDKLETFIEAGLQTGFGNDWLHLGGVKLFADGALGPQTAAMLQPYEGTNESGNLLLTEDEIVEIGKKAVSHGIPLTVHAIGDRANHVVLNAYERLRIYEQTHALRHFKHRIEHVQIIDPKDLCRMVDLDIIASVQPVHAPSDMVMADRQLGVRSKNAYGYQSMIKSGCRVVFGSDAPVEPVNPFLGIHAAVTRRRPDGAPGQEGWQPEQRLTLSQALEGFSRTPAEITGRGGTLGRIAPGYKADFLILEDDPFKCDPHKLQSIQPSATFIEGICKFQSQKLSFDLSD
jgi:predicted amidohydrolase YtcJ